MGGPASYPWSSSTSGDSHLQVCLRAVPCRFQSRQRSSPNRGITGSAGRSDRHDLLDVGVLRRLHEDLLAHEARGPGEQHPEPRPTPQGGEPGLGLLLQRADPELELLLGQVRRLPEAERGVSSIRAISPNISPGP